MKWGEARGMRSDTTAYMMDLAMQRHATIRYTDVAFTDGSLQPATKEEPARVAFGLYATGAGF